MNERLYSKNVTKKSKYSGFQLKLDCLYTVIKTLISYRLPLIFLAIKNLKY